MILSIALCFFYRYRAILPSDHWFSLKVRTIAIFFAVLYFSYLFLIWVGIWGFHFEHPPIAAGLNKLLEDYPQYAFVEKIADAWIADLKTPLPIFSLYPKTLLILLLVIGIPGIILLGTALTLHAFHLLNSPIIPMSPKTRALHKKLVRGLALQVSTPMFSMAVPGVIVVFTVITDSFSQQWFINALTFLFSLHGGFGSLSIILFTESYRQHTRNCLKIVARSRLTTTYAFVQRKPVRLLPKTCTCGGSKTKLVLKIYIRLRFNIYMSPPASSVSSERVFSTCGLIWKNSRRQRMAPTTLKSALRVSLNQKYMKLISFVFGNKC
ncbi:unnamed protein product, partial [Mesorhabditis belari]|uniref:G protein-coupled receptor n=1 Tax=Mesorhabditis belari TaxID=2138241 RepID=A0AAF3F8C1_9BILA